MTEMRDEWDERWLRWEMTEFRDDWVQRWGASELRCECDMT